MEEISPTSKQLELYLLYWESRLDPLAPDPGVGVWQKSVWLDPDDLDVNAYEAECFRGSRPDRALFIRRLIATYHKSRTSKQVTLPHRPVPQPAPHVISAGLTATSRQILEPASAASAVREQELSPAQVNEISRLQGHGICWQPGNLYRIGRTANEKSCLLQIRLGRKASRKVRSWWDRISLMVRPRQPKTTTSDAPDLGCGSDGCTEEHRIARANRINGVRTLIKH
jgi:hypothetical protein